MVHPPSRIGLCCFVAFNMLQKTEGMRLLGRPKSRWENNTNLDLKETG
jgi:hypothetical protein